MSDERRDDEIIGRALSRAIETIDVNQTPFERSRIAVPPARRSIFGLWQIATAAAAIVLALAIGTWLTRPAEDRGPVAASPTVPPGSSSAAVTPAPGTATPSQDRIWVYFARDGLPPTGAFVTCCNFLDNTQQSRIASRITALGAAVVANQVPAGTTSALSHDKSGGIAVRVQGDVATVEFDPSNSWGVSGSAQSLALVQQLVYTITEEPGINRALITEKGKANAVIDQRVVDKPLSREDVSGYDAVKIGGSISQDGPAGGRLSYTTSTDKLAPGLTRFVVTAQETQTPRFSVQAGKGSDTAPSPGKYVLTVQVFGSDEKQGLETFDSSPLRGVVTTKNVATGTGSAVTTYSLFLDDLRPWRVFTLSNPTRVVVDIGGAPQSISDRIAVYRAEPSAATPVCSNTCDVQLSGAARVFEANVVWRVKDTAGKVIAKGQFLASLGSSPVWGTFDTSIQVPSTFRGNATLEVYEASAKDGSEQGLVHIPLVIR
jgi:hypothetical protein